MVLIFLTPSYGGHPAKSGVFGDFRVRSFQSIKNQHLYLHRFFPMTKTRCQKRTFTCSCVLVKLIGPIFLTPFIWGPLRKKWRFGKFSSPIFPKHKKSAPLPPWIFPYDKNEVSKKGTLPGPGFWPNYRKLPDI